LEHKINVDKRMDKILGFVNPKEIDKILVIGTGIYPSIEEILYKKFKIKHITSGDIENKNIENGMKTLPSLNFIYLDAQKKMPFKEDTFDKIILTEVLEHLRDEKIVLYEIKRILKKRGDFILSVPKRRWFNLFNPITYVQHVREYNEKSIRKVLGKNGFKVKKMFVGGSIFDILNLWIHLIYKHLFGVLHLENFFQSKFEKSYEEDFVGRGTDIIILALQNKSY